MFKFPLTVADISEVPTEFQAIYVKSEADDSATLIDDLKKRVEVTENLQKTLTTERKGRADAEREVKAWKAKSGTDTAEALADLLTAREAEYETAIAAAREQTGDKDGDLAKRIEQVKEDLQRKHVKDIEKLTSERDEIKRRSESMRVSMEKNMREEAAVRAIAANKGNVKLLKPHVMARTKVVEEDGEYVLRVVDEDGDARYDGDGKHMSVELLVTSLKGTDDFMAAFDSDGATGGGTRAARANMGGKSPNKNPWSKETFNLTEQMRISKENPAMASALKSSAVR